MNILKLVSFVLVSLLLANVTKAQSLIIEQNGDKYVSEILVTNPLSGDTIVLKDVERKIIKLDQKSWPEAVNLHLDNWEIPFRKGKSTVIKNFTAQPWASIYFAGENAESNNYWLSVLRKKEQIVEDLKYKSILIDSTQYLPTIKEAWRGYKSVLGKAEKNYPELSPVVKAEIKWLEKQSKKNWKIQMYWMGVNYRRLSFKQRMRDIWNTEAIDFSAINQKGESVNLSDLKGEPIVLDFWATWCGPCKKEVPYWNKKINKYGDQVHFVSVGVKCKKEKWKQNISENKADFHWYLSEEKMQQIKPWNVYFIPRYIFINKNFKVVATDAPKPSSQNFDEVLKRNTK